MIKRDELRHGHRIVLPPVPDEQMSRERCTVDDFEDGFVYVTVHHDDREGTWDDGIREVHIEELPEELETW